MTVSNPTRAVTFTGNGVTTVFPFTFLIPEGTAVITLTVIATGIEGDALTEGVDYSITGEDVEAGGSITYPLSGAALASTHKITIKSIITPSQPLDLTNQSAYVPTQLESQLDTITLVQLQQAEQLSRAVTIPSGSSTSSEDVLEDLALVAINSAAATAAASSASASELAAAASASAAAASAVLADASADAAALSEAAADADRLTVAADKATVAADKATVAADKATVAVDKATVASNTTTTNTNAGLTAADVVSAEAARAAAVVAQLAAEAAAGGLTAVEVQINAATAKATPVDADLLATTETAGPTLKKTTFLQAWNNYFKAKADALYQPIASVLTSLATLGGSLASGNIIYATAANTLARLATGTNGHVLTLAAGVPSWAAVAASGPTLLTEQATTSGTTKDFTIPAGAKRVTVMFDGVSYNSGTQLGIQLGDSGGIEATGYVGATGNFTNGAATVITIQHSTWAIAGTAGDGSALYYGAVTFSRENETHTWVYEGNVTNGSAIFPMAGRKTLSAELTTVRLMNGTFDAGVANVMWE